MGWRGHGNDKVWAPIEGTFQNVPYDECKDVAKTHAKQVAYQECNDVPEQKCVSVPKQTCVTVPDQICKTEPLTECQDVPRQQCHSEHKRFPVRISRQAHEGLRRGAQHRSSCSCCRPPSPCPSPSFSLSAGSPQLRRPRRPHTDCAPDHCARDKQKLQSAAKDDRIVFA